MRLRNQLFEKEQRLASLIQLREQVERPPEPAPPKITRTLERTPDAALDALQVALTASGLGHLRVVEGHVADGVLRDALLAELDLMGTTRSIRDLAQLELVSQAGVVYLELTPLSTPVEDEQAGEPAARDASVQRGLERVRLASWDAELWQPTGLRLPSVMLPVEDVQAALELLLVGTRLEIQELGGFEHGELLGLELTERDGLGTHLRNLRAGRGVILADGPALLLYDGEVVQDGDTRAFYKGRHRVPLPGADHEAWRAAVGG